MPALIPIAAAAFASAVTVVSAASTFIAAVGGLTLTAGGLGAGITVAGLAKVGMAAYSVYNMLKKPKAASGSPSPVAFKADPNAYISFVAGGPVAVGGNIVHGQTTGAKNKYLVYLTALSHGGPVHSISQQLVDDVGVAYGADQGQGATGTFLNRMWQRTAVGLMAGTFLALTATGSKDTPGDHGGHPAEWNNTHVGVGIAQSIWCLEADPAKFPAIPKPTWIVRGGPVYDPRQDSTFPGGVGAQRWNDRNTWSTDGNQNPFLQALTFAIGHVYNGIRVGGVGMPIKGIDRPAFAYAANIADANGWKIAWTWNTGMRKWDVLAAMLQAGGGQPLVRGGMLSCSVEAPRVSLGEITDADIRGEFSVTGSANVRVRMNTLIPRAKSPDHKWAIMPYGEVTASTYVDEDGGIIRPREVEYEAVNGGTPQLRQLCAYDLANLREGLTATIPLAAKFLRYRAGDCLTVNAPTTLMNGQKVVILKREFDAQARKCLLTVRSETDAKHAWALGQTNVPPPSPALTGRDGLVVEAPAPAAWGIEPGAVPGGAGGIGGGTSVPIIVVNPSDPEGAHVDDPAAESIVVRYRRVGLNPATGLVYPWVYEEFPATSEKLEVKGLAPNIAYELEMAYRVRGIVGAYRSYGIVTTADLVATGALYLGTGPTRKPAADIITALFDPSGVVAQLESAVEDLDDAINAANTGLNDRVNALAGQLNTPVTGIAARVVTAEQDIVDLETGKADASRVTLLEARSVTRPNLMANGGFQRANPNGTPYGWSGSNCTLLAFDGLVRGRLGLVTPVAGSTACSADYVMPSSPGVIYAIHADIQHLVTDGLGAAYLDLIFRDAANSVLLDGPQNPRSGSFNFSDDDATRKIVAVAATAPANTANMVARVVFTYTSPATVTSFGVRQVKVEAGGLPYSAYSDDASNVSLNSRVATVETATTDLANGKADASRVTALEATVKTPVTGLSARTTAAEQAVVNLQAGKADASRVTALEATVNTPGTGLSARTGSLETATANLQTGKADATRVTALEATVNTPGTGLSAKVTALESATTNLQTGKADASRVTAIESKIVVGRPNLLRNSDFSQGGTKYWVKSPGMNLVAYSNRTLGNLVTYFPTAVGDYLYQDHECVPGEVFSLSFEGDYTTTAVGHTYFQFINAAQSAATYASAALPALGWDVRQQFESPPAPANSAYVRIVTFAGGTGAFSGTRYMLARGGGTPIWNDFTSAGDISARVVTTEDAVVDLRGRTYARWAIGTAVPGAAAFIYAQAEVTPGSAPTSDVGIGGRVVSIYNPTTEGWSEALRVEAGNVLLSGGLRAGAFIRLGSGVGWPVALASQDFAATDGQTVSFGTNLGAVPSLTFAGDNLAPLNAGETYQLYADSLSGTGFVARLKIAVPASPSNVALGPTTTVQGSGPRLQLVRSPNPESTTGSYTYSAGGPCRLYLAPYDEVGAAYGAVNVGLWAKKDGVWISVGTMSVPVEAYGTPSTHPVAVNITYSGSQDVYVGTGATEFGVSFDGTTGQASDTGTNVNTFSLAYQGAGTPSGTRSATPAGQLSTITVRPKA
jgi:hypothetical protein